MALMEEAGLTPNADPAHLHWRFQVIDPPTPEFAAVASKRALLIRAALLASLAAGAGVAYALHLLRPVFVSPR